MLLLAKFKIAGHSMEPQIKTGDTVLVSRVPYWFKIPKINDIVAFKDNNGKILIKRIVRIQNRKYFVQGDNRNDSLDSRRFGYISKKQIIGEFIYKL
jgi:nickel-type superoxide dismutase maturation protease